MAPTARMSIVKSMTTNIHDILDELNDVMLTKHRTAILDSKHRTEGLAAFYFEFGGAATSWLYRRYTYLFVDYVRSCGVIHSMIKHNPRNVVGRYDEATSMMATLAYKEIADISFDDPHLSQYDMIKTVNRIGKEFSLPSELMTVLRREFRQHYKDYTSETGYYRCPLHQLLLTL